MEEDCDGLCWQYLINEEKLRPEFVVITEPTNLNIYRGHRGRMEIQVEVEGRSAATARAPERGDNAIYKIARIALEIEKLNERLRDRPVPRQGHRHDLGGASSSPSLCAVADGAGIHLDRRLTLGETKDSAIGGSAGRRAPRGLSRRQGLRPQLRGEAAYTGKVYPTEKYFPTWAP